jgi:hypothetical protein
VLGYGRIYYFLTGVKRSYGGSGLYSQCQRGAMGGAIAAMIFNAAVSSPKINRWDNIS